MVQLPIKQRKAVIGFVSRPRSKYNSRAVINEAEVVAALAKHYGAAADVRTLHFNRSLTQAMQDVADLDIMVGVHGAGGAPMLALHTGRRFVHVVVSRGAGSRGSHACLGLGHGVAVSVAACLLLTRAVTLVKPAFRLDVAVPCKQAA